MKIKIIRQFGAAIAALLIFYGVVATTYRSYETVLAAQVEIPLAIVVKQTSADVESEMVMPAVSTVAASTVTSSTATTTTETASVAASAASAPATTTTTEVVTAPAAASVQEETAAIVQATPAAQEPVVTAPVPVVPSLSEFLSQFRCGGCGKNCSLLNPRCGVGSQKAQQAESEYYATYS